MACCYVQVIISMNAPLVSLTTVGNIWAPLLSLAAFLCYWALLAVTPCTTPHQLATVVCSPSSCFPFFSSSSSPPGPESVIHLAKMPALRADAMFTFSCKVRESQHGRAECHRKTHPHLWLLHGQLVQSTSVCGVFPGAGSVWCGPQTRDTWLNLKWEELKNF